MRNEGAGPIVISVVGPQNAGKTTLIARMCAYWAGQGVRVGVIKHDGHADMAGGNDWQKPGSDTVLYAEAGAQLTLVAGGNESLLWTKSDPAAADVDQLCQRLAAHAAENGTPLDVILVEGYKRSNLSKIVPVRRAADITWLDNEHLSNLRAVVCADAVYQLAHTTWRVYHENDVQRLCDDVWR